MKKKYVTMCGIVLLVFFAVSLCGCRGKKTSKKGQATPAETGTEQSVPKPSGKSGTGLHPVPPDLPVSIEDAKPDRHPLLVYWSNTNSDEYYIKEGQFYGFFKAFEGTLAYGYEAQYFCLKNESGIVRWNNINAQQFNPLSKEYYGFIRGGDYEKRGGRPIGPLKMLYENGLVRPEDLTVVVSDLHEQDFNLTALATAIRKMLFSDEGSRNAAAIIALSVPFDGVDTWSDINTGADKEQYFRGEKPLYMVVTGKKDAVAVFVRAYEVAAKDKVKYELVTTLFPGDIKPVSLNGITIPQSANLKDQRDVDRNKGVLKNLWNFRNETASRIWNLTDETRSMVKYVGIPDNTGTVSALTNEKLNLRLLRYKRMGGGAKNGHRLWQLNIEFAMPAGYDFSRLEAEVENYRYLSEGEWKGSSALLANDLEVSKTPFPVDGNAERAGVYVVPRSQKGTVDAGKIVYFEVVLRAPVVIPGWVRDFNDDQGGTNPGKTQDFRAFVNVVLGLNAGTDSVILETGNELARVPVMLLDIPSKKGR